MLGNSHSGFCSLCMTWKCVVLVFTVMKSVLCLGTGIFVSTFWGEPFNAVTDVLGNLALVADFLSSSRLPGTIIWIPSTSSFFKCIHVWPCIRPSGSGVPGGCELHGVGAGNQTLLRFSGLCLWGTGLLLWFSWLSVLELFLFGCCGWAEKWDGTKAHSDI